MPASPLAVAMMGGAGDTSGLGVDPAVMAAMPDIQLGQSLIQQGVSTAPASPLQALARVLQAGAGSYIQHSAMSDLAKAYANTAEDMAQAIEKTAPNSPLIPGLRSKNPTVKMMTLQQAGKAMTLMAEPQKTSPGQQVSIGTGPIFGNTQPRSPDMILQGDIDNSRRPATNSGPNAVPTAAVPPPQPHPNQNPLSNATGFQVEDDKGNVTGGGTFADNGTISPAGDAIKMQADKAAATEQAKTIAEAKGKRIGEVIEAGGRNAREMMNTLNVMEDAFDSGKGHLFTGPGAEMAADTKRAIQNFLGIPVTGLTETEIIQKLNGKLASETTREMTARGTQFEFRTNMLMNPGLMNSPEGTKALINVLKQTARQNIDLGRHALNQKNVGNWGEFENEYYKTHPIVSPLTGKPLTGGTEDLPAVAKGGAPAAAPQQAGGAPAGAVHVSTPEEARKLPRGTTIILPDGSMGKVP